MDPNAKLFKAHVMKLRLKSHLFKDAHLEALTQVEELSHQKLFPRNN